MSHYKDRNSAWRRAAMLAVMAACTLLVAACGGSSSRGGSSTGSGGPSPAAGSTTYYQRALSYAQCMRSHGVPNYPDPTSSGGFTVPNSINLNSAQGQAARKACLSLLPSGPISQAQLQKTLGLELKFVQCLRSHGFPNLPDPVSGGSSGVSAAIPVPKGININSPRWLAAQQACRSLNDQITKSITGSGS